jgi:uncharacterized protein (TIGR01777 family)
MNVVMAGGTGFLGPRIAEMLLGAGHRVVVLTRRPDNAALPGGVETEMWDGRSPGGWVERIAEADAVINLAGKALNAGRWTARRKERIVSSRVDVTRLLVRAMTDRPRRRILINASGVGFYGNVPEGEVREERGPGTGFLATTCAQWEHEALRAQESGSRVILLRLGVVLGERGGALTTIMLPFRLFAGGPIGSGRQWFPWIHREDVAAGVQFALENSSVNGALNFTAPEQVTMEMFSRTLGRAMHRPALMRVPSTLLRILLGEMSEIVLQGQQAVPAKLLEQGYRFRHPRLEEALSDVLGKKKEGRG